MKTCILRPDRNRWLLTEEDGRLVTAYSTKGDALRGAARRVSMVFGRLIILRADGTVEEDRRYPPPEASES
jgi:hypothetical protein